MNYDKLVDISYDLLNWDKHPLRSFHVSFLLRRSKILSIGVNQRKTHTINLRNRKLNRQGIDISDAKYQCSEYTCLKKSKTQNIDYSKCAIFNVRIDRNNKVGIARPCESCESLLSHFQINEIYFTNENGIFVPYSQCV